MSRNCEQKYTVNYTHIYNYGLSVTEFKASNWVYRPGLSPSNSSDKIAILGADKGLYTVCLNAVYISGGVITGLPNTAMPTIHVYVRFCTV